MSRNIDGQLLKRFMPDLHKFYKGERVMTSELALENGVVIERKYGVVVGYGRNENTLLVRFDGEQTTRTLHEDFLSADRQETPCKHDEGGSSDTRRKSTSHRSIC